MRLSRLSAVLVAHIEAERIAKRNKKIAIIATPIVCAVIVFLVVLNSVIIPNSKYKKAVALMNAEQHEDAITIFEELDNYKDSSILVNDCKYNKAAALMQADKPKEALSVFMQIYDYKDAAEQLKPLWDRVDVRETISAGYEHTVGLRADGTVVAVGDDDYGQIKVANWSNIKVPNT